MKTLSATRALRAPIALGLALLMAACSPKPASFQSMDVTGAPWGQTYALPDLQGQQRTPESFVGKTTVVFFGFLYCPDVCPAHLAKMQAVKATLGKAGEQVQVVFITVDPERDTPEALGPFLASFDPGIVGLRGSVEQTKAVAKDFRVYFKKAALGDGKDPKNYTVDHTTFAYVYDAQARLRLVVPHNLTAEQLADDLRLLMAQR